MNETEAFHPGEYSVPNIPTELGGLYFLRGKKLKDLRENEIRRQIAYLEKAKILTPNQRDFLQYAKDFLSSK